MRFGILGDAKISRNHIIPAMQENGFSLVHLGTREPKGQVLNITAFQRLDGMMTYSQIQK